MEINKVIDIIKGLKVLSTRSNNVIGDFAGEAIDIAVEALEKQIVKKPVFEFNCVAIDGETPSGCPVCPSCKEPTYNLRWCGFCGQHLEGE